MAETPDNPTRLRRVLALDGGGIRGALPAAFLAVLEEEAQAPLWKFFDLVVGTSTGGILALGIARGVPAKTLLELYTDQGPTVFSSSWTSRTAGFLRPRYKPDQLEAFLRGVFGEALLGECLTRVVVPAVDLEAGRVHLLKTRHLARFSRDHALRIVDVALATSAAPTYFPTHIGQDGTALVDGGLFANNPCGLAAVEATAVLGWPRDQVSILSVGCGQDIHDFSAIRRRSSLLKYASRILPLMFSAQSSASLGTAQHLVGHENVVRIDPSVAPTRFSLSGHRHARALAGYGSSEARHALPQLRERFLGEMASPFVPPP